MYEIVYLRADGSVRYRDRQGTASVAWARVVNAAGTSEAHYMTSPEGEVVWSYPPPKAPGAIFPENCKPPK